MPEPRQRYRQLSADRGPLTAAKDRHWRRRSVPCQAACPAGTDIPAYLDAIHRGRDREAYEINLRDNVFPGVLGRVCTRPCEPACRHGDAGNGEPLAICAAKRAAADTLAADPVALPVMSEKSGKRVAVVGAGVAGLAAARDLAVWGHEVTVFERHAQPGGMMILGIPAFRLPRDVVAREIEQVRLVGVNIVCNVDVGGDLTVPQLLADFDAVVIAVGATVSRALDLPGVTLPGVSSGLEFLASANTGTAPDLTGRRVVVVGGGFTALDCARTAWRLCAEPVIYYRRTTTQMQASEAELRELENESIGLQTLVSPLGFNGNDRLESVSLIRNELGADSGAQPLAGTQFSVAADLVLLAVGQEPQSELLDLQTGDSWPPARPQTHTDRPGLFVAGDFALGSTTLIDAIGHARACAVEVDAYLCGPRPAAALEVADVRSLDRDRKLNAVPRQPLPVIPVNERSLTAEVELGYGETTSRVESSRCYLCQHKFEIDNDACVNCDACLYVMPVADCIVWVRAFEFDEDDIVTGWQRSTTYRDENVLYIDPEKCIRCGACVEVCPVDCITVQRVTSSCAATVAPGGKPR